MSNRYLLYGAVRYAIDVLRPLQAAIRRRGDEAAWFFEGNAGLELVAGERLLGSIEEAIDWNACALLTPSVRPPSFLPGAKVYVFHGFDAGKPRHIYDRGFFDLYCTTGPADTAAFRALAARLGHFAVTETGWPKLDPLFALREGNEATPVRTPPVVLYASTFSPSWTSSGLLHDEISRLSRGGRWRWIVTMHPKMNPATVEKYRALASDNLQFLEKCNVIDLFSQADAMLCDTSSALSEFLFTGKAVVTFRNRRPGPHLIDIGVPSAVEPALERALARPPELMDEIHRYTQSIHPYRDGRSSERVLAAVDDFLAGGGARNLRRKPRNLWRNFALRRRFGYWRFR